MSNSKVIEGAKRRLPPPPPIISGPTRRSAYYNDSVDNCQLQSRSNDSVETYEYSYRRRSSGPCAADQGPPPLKIRKGYSAQLDQSENTSLHEESTQPTAAFSPTKQIVRGILNADEVKIPRRPEESKKPIFDRPEITASYNYTPSYKYNLVLADPVPTFKPVPFYPAETADRYNTVIDNTDLRYILRQKQVFNASIEENNIQNQVAKKVIGISQRDTNEMISYKNSAFVTTSLSSLPKTIDLESDGRRTKKYDKRSNQLQNVDDYYNKPGAICGDQRKTYSTYRSRRDQSAKDRRSSHSDEFGNLGISRSEGEANAKGAEVIDFKKMTLDWAANAPGGHPSQRIGFLIRFFKCCSAQELYWAKNWATNISQEKNTMVLKGKK